MNATTTPPAGWYANGQVLRWWDGQAWTHHTTTTPHPHLHPTTPPTVVVVGGRRAVGGVEHVMHLCLTVCTFGLWAPVWVVRTLSGRK